jgi:hypothetical protein
VRRLKLWHWIPALSTGWPRRPTGTPRNFRLARGGQSQCCGEPFTRIIKQLRCGLHPDRHRHHQSLWGSLADPRFKPCLLALVIGVSRRVSEPGAREGFLHSRDDAGRVSAMRAYSRPAPLSAPCDAQLAHAHAHALSVRGECAATVVAAARTRALVVFKAQLVPDPHGIAELGSTPLLGAQRVGRDRKRRCLGMPCHARIARRDPQRDDVATDCPGPLPQALHAHVIANSAVCFTTFGTPCNGWNLCSGRRPPRASGGDDG